MQYKNSQAPLKAPRREPPLPKAPTGIAGLDEITGGGLPRGRPTLICGGAGCGKTIMAMEFLVQGAVAYGEPGVFMAFEESPEDLDQNFAALGANLKTLVASKKLVIDCVQIDRDAVSEAGAYDLEALFIRLGAAIDAVGAKRVVIDTLEVLFAGLSNAAVLRSELQRLFRWLKDKGVTSIVTGERGEKTLTRIGLEEYVADCVIVLDHRVEKQSATRRLRIAKYRGAGHGTSEYPFLIEEHGISIFPITSIGLRQKASAERVSSGVVQLDTMLGGAGYYRGSSVLVSGTAGSGKTSLAAHFAHAATARGERCLWFHFEEATGQLVRNARSIGIDLEPALRRKLLHIECSRPTTYGLEMHLVSLHRLVNEFSPKVVILDPISNFAALGNDAEVKSMLVRMIDFLKTRQITALLTNLTQGGAALEATDSDVSSIVDTWLVLRDLENGAERNRVLHVLKSRGMAHSNQLREFILTDHGVRLREVYVGPSGDLLTGSARDALEGQETAQALIVNQDGKLRERALERKRQALQARIAMLEAEFEADRTEAATAIEQDRQRAAIAAGDRLTMARLRRSDASPANSRKPKGSNP